MIPVGFPSYYPKPRDVKPLEDLVHYGKFDQKRNYSENELMELLAKRKRAEIKAS
jgi:hypothetical protein